MTDGAMKQTETQEPLQACLFDLDGVLVFTDRYHYLAWKSIADENGIRMPSFFGYLIWSFGILVPVFIVDTLVFFL